MKNKLWACALLATGLFLAVISGTSPATEVKLTKPIELMVVGCPPTATFAYAATTKDLGEWHGETTGDIQNFQYTANFYKVFVVGPDNQGRPGVRCQYNPVPGFGVSATVSLYRVYPSTMTCTAAADHLSYSCKNK